MYSIKAHFSKPSYSWFYIVMEKQLEKLTLQESLLCLKDGRICRPKHRKYKNKNAPAEISTRALCFTWNLKMFKYINCTGVGVRVFCF